MVQFVRKSGYTLVFVHTGATRRVARTGRDDAIQVCYPLLNHAGIFHRRRGNGPRAHTGKGIMQVHTGPGIQRSVVS